MDALWFGCIPVFLADHYVPPLYDLIPWQTISLAVLESQVCAVHVVTDSLVCLTCIICRYLLSSSSFRVFPINKLPQCKVTY